MLGNVTLRDINLRPEELNDFFAMNKVPLTVRAGLASKMSLTVSLNSRRLLVKSYLFKLTLLIALIAYFLQFSVISFHSKPIEIEFDDLCLICGPSLHHMSHDTSFLQRRAPQYSSRSDFNNNGYDDDSESSYDSTNAFNVN